MISSRLLLAVAAAAITAGGCATLQENNADVRLVTQYGVLKIADTVEEAEKIEAIALEIQKYATDTTYLTVDALLVAIRARVPWHNLDAADTLLVNVLLDRLRDELVARLGPDAVPADVQLAVNTVAKWVIESAQIAKASLSRA